MHLRHKFTVAGAQWVKLAMREDMYLYLGIGMPQSMPTHTVTDVLYRCSCGAVKTKRIEGKWTLEQLAD